MPHARPPPPPAGASPPPGQGVQPSKFACGPSPIQVPDYARDSITNRIHHLLTLSPDKPSRTPSPMRIDHLSPRVIPAAQHGGTEGSTSASATMPTSKTGTGAAIPPAAMARDLFSSEQLRRVSPAEQTPEAAPQHSFHPYPRSPPKFVAEGSQHIVRTQLIKALGEADQSGVGRQGLTGTDASDVATFVNDRKGCCETLLRDADIAKANAQERALRLQKRVVGMVPIIMQQEEEIEQLKRQLLWRDHTGFLEALLTYLLRCTALHCTELTYCATWHETVLH